MLDHISLRVQDFHRALEFYRSALAPIGYELVMEFPGAAGLGEKGKPDFWIMQSDKPLNPTHVAFVSSRPLVDAFHAAALAAGGTDNGPPGLRLDYHPHYYGAFVRDPEGNNIEVVCHEPPGAKPEGSSRKASARAPKRATAARPAGKSKGGGKSKKKAKAKPKAKAKAKKRR
jgi:catechol 2,3-dioxygenase-like lactoylglutathione lyase family enzyme